MNELTPSQKRTQAAGEFSRKYGQHWLVYLALAFTATLSFVSGLVLPFTPDANGIVAVSFGGILAAGYYSLGFITNGEAAANYWFSKLTDHDKDNTTQKVIASLMLTISVIVSLVTALAAAAQIAYLIGVLAEFQSMPSWAQEWVVWSIPTMWTLNAVSGMAFKAFSDEADAERSANAVISAAKLEITTRRVDARAKYWRDNAADIADRLGQMEAQSEIAKYAVKLNIAPPPMTANAATVQGETLAPKDPAGNNQN